MKEFCRYI